MNTSEISLTSEELALCLSGTLALLEILPAECEDVHKAKALHGKFASAAEGLNEKIKRQENWERHLHEQSGRN